LGVKGGILADDIESHPTLLKRLDSIRRKASVAMGLSSDEASAPGSIPKIAIISSPHSHELLSGKKVGPEYCDLVVRAISVGQPHRAVPVTVAMALAVASQLPGSLVYKNTKRPSVDSSGVTIGHNSGRLLVGANFDNDNQVKAATVFRTSRRIMDGKIYWK
jgi:2-methylaconitate cis-trans-isomerase PrpF